MVGFRVSEHALALGVEEEIGSLRKKKLLEISKGVRSRVFLRLRADTQQGLLDSLSDGEVLVLLKNADPDETTDILQRVSSLKRRRLLLEELQEDIKHKVEFLLRFHPQSAAGLMSLDYVLVSSSQSFSSVERVVVKHERRTGRFPSILVEEDGLVVGELKDHLLTVKNPRSRISGHVSAIHSIRYDASEVDVVKSFRESRHNKVVVLDDSGFVLGVIYSDDVLRLLQDEPVKSLYSFAGLKKEESVNDSIGEKVKNRYKWLIVSLFAAFLVAATITPFEKTIENMVLLAVYLPVVAMMGGNAATQTLAVIIRGLTLNQINKSNARTILFREVISGVLNGILVGVLVGVLAFFINSNFLFGVVIGLAMIFNLFIAGFFGTLIPLVIKHFGQDPAPSAIMFIITLTDVFGFLSFLGLATVLL